MLAGVRGFAYGEFVDVFEGVRIRFTDAGHLLGSSSVEVWATEDGVTKKLVFSGDIGNIDQPIVRDPQTIEVWVGDSNLGASCGTPLMCLYTQINKSNGSST